MQETDDPAHQNELHTEPRVHDDCVVQGVTDGHKPVIGNHSQDKVLQLYKKQEEGCLCDAACISDGFILCLDVHQHLGNNARGETHIIGRQVGKEEVHRRVEVGVREDGQDDKQVPNDSEQVHGEKQPEDERLWCWVL